MPTYVYYPGSRFGNEEEIDRWASGRQRKGKTPYEVVTDLDLPTLRDRLRGRITHHSLSKVSETDKLYVSGHGNASDPTTFAANRSDGSSQRYTPTELAEHLARHGLTKRLRDLRIWACNSGSGPYPFAQRLKAALLARGYTAVSVTGYQGQVHATHDNWPSKDGSHGLKNARVARLLGAEDGAPWAHKGTILGPETFFAQKRAGDYKKIF